ncbi:hypothetical protein BC826DRAFT_1181582 [Russula brevipes]|nr:hypothetical protein BC826DRAFT_1181582 [Russula brevipes]
MSSSTASGTTQLVNRPLGLRPPSSPTFLAPLLAASSSENSSGSHTTSSTPSLPRSRPSALRAQVDLPADYLIDRHGNVIAPEDFWPELDDDALDTSKDPIAGEGIEREVWVKEGQEKTPVKKMLDIWPAIPVSVSSCADLLHDDADNVFAALEHRDRISSVLLRIVSDSLWERFIEVMQGPFQALTHLTLRTFRHRPALPDSFLGGSVPRLRILHFVAIPFPGLWKLLPSASNLVCLSLYQIPDSMYISPEAMVTCLSALTRLLIFRLEFATLRSLPYRASRYQPSLTYVNLPTLIQFSFTGVSWYLEDLVLQINTPLLDKLNITLFDHHIVNTSQLPRFIDRTGNFGEHNKAYIFIDHDIMVILPATKRTDGRASLTLNIPHGETDQQFSSISRVFSSTFPPFSRLECLYIRGERFWGLTPQDYTASWQDLLHAFTALKDLYLARVIALRVAPALEQLDETRVTEILPALQNLFLGGPRPSEAVRRFVAQRQLSGHPVAVHSWDGVSVT